AIHWHVDREAPASFDTFRVVYHEWFIITPVRLVRGVEVVADVFRLVLAQIRSRHETAGDFRAQVAANATGGRRLGALLDRQGPETVDATMHELLDYTERRTRAAVAHLPRGVFTAEGSLDNDGFT